MGLSLRNVGKRFGENFWALKSLDLEIADGEFFSLLGPSGCGKTTTLRMVAGLETVTEGDIFLSGRRLNDVPPQKRDVAMVFQDYALYPTFTVFDNIAFNLELRRLPRAHIRERVQMMAELLGIDHLLDRRPRQLSGGERQRVALGRALVRKPRLFLLDEPLSNLDLKLREKLRIELHKIHSDMGTTTIFVTHDQGEAMILSHRLAVLHDGRVLQVGDPKEIYESPASVFVADFVGSPSINFLRGVLRPGGVLDLGKAGREAGQSFTLGSTLNYRNFKCTLPHQVLVGLRPEHFKILLERDSASIEVTIEIVEHGGSQVYLVAQLPTASDFIHGNDRLVVLLDRDHDIAPGQRIWVKPTWQKATFFDPTTEANLETSG